MADNTDYERLILEFQANTASVNRALVQFARDVDTRTRRVEQVVDRMNRRVTSSFNNAARGFRTISNSLLGGAAFVGISRFVSAVVNTASKIQDTADAIGISTDALQSYGIQAGRVGVDQEKLNLSLAKFAKGLGDAADAATPLSRELLKLGIGPNQGIEEVLLDVADAMAKLPTQAEKASLAVRLFGRSGVQMVPFLQQGRAAIQATTAELVRNGSIITTQNLKALDNLDDKWADLQRRFIAIGGNVLAGFTDEFIRLADELQDDELLRDMQAFGESLAQIAAVIAQLAPILPNLFTAFAGLRIGSAFGPVGAAIGATLGFLTPEFLDQTVTDLERIKALMADIRDLQARLSPSNVADAGLSQSDIQVINDEIVEKTNQLLALQAKVTAAQAATTPTPAGGGGGGVLEGESDQKTIAQSVDELEQARQRLLEAVNQADIATTTSVAEKFRLERQFIIENTEQSILAAQLKRDAAIEALEEELEEGKLSAQAFKQARLNIEDQFVAESQTLIERRRADIARLYDDELQRAINLRNRLADITAESTDAARQAREERIRAETEQAIQQAQGTPDEFTVNSEAQRKLIDDQEAADVAAAEARLARRQEELDREIDILRREGEAHQELLDAKVLAEQAAADEIAAIRTNATTRRLQQSQQENDLLLQHASDFFGNLASLSRSGNDTLAAIGKAAAIAQATIDGILAVQKALASAPPPINFALAAAVGAATAANIAQIAAMEKGGIVGPRGEVPVRKYARGGVATGPQLALFGEGSKNEAFVPLPDGRRIPVELSVPEIEPSASTGGFQQVFAIDARGAQAGVGEEIARQLQLLGPKLAAQQLQIVNKALPDMVKTATRRKL